MGIRFDGTGDGLFRTTGLPTISAYSILGWFKLSADRNAFTTFISFGDVAGGGQAKIQTAADGTTLNLYNGTIDIGGSALGVGTWNHLAMTCSGTSLIAYLNGVSNASGTQAAAVSAEKIWIGNDDGDQWIDGVAGDIKIYSAVLNAADIVSEMRSQLPYRTVNINGFYPLWNTSDLGDYSGNGNNFTTGGTLATEDGPPVPWRMIRRRFVFPQEQDVFAPAEPDQVYPFAITQRVG